MTEVITASTTVHFTRMHVCQYCGQKIEYPLKERCSASGYFNLEAVNYLKKCIQDTTDTLQKAVPCPRCGLYQHAMVSDLFNRTVPLRILVVCGILFYLWYTMDSRIDVTQTVVRYAILAVLLAMMVFQWFRIRKFIRKSPESLRSTPGTSDDSVATYLQIRHWYRSLARFLVVLMVSLLLPHGAVLGACGLLIFYLRIGFQPKLFCAHGLPFFCRDVTTTRY